MPSIWPTARLTSAMPSACSVLAMLMRPMMSFTWRTEDTMSPMLAPASLTEALPRSMMFTESAMRPLISLAAAAERWARVRTSEATTAKPRPCSPARAASTAAFRARILVWNEMPSMTPMISTILRELAWIDSIVVTACCTAWPPRDASCDACAASSEAWRALLALSLTAVVRVSMVLAVCSSEPACISVRVERSRFPLAISCDAVSIERTAFITLCRAAFRRAMVWSSARAVSSISSRPFACKGGASSRPSASSPTVRAIALIPPSIERRTSIVTASDSPIDSSTRPAMLRPRLRNSALAAAWASSLIFFSSWARRVSSASRATNCCSAFCIELVAIDWSMEAISMVSPTALR